MNPANTPTSLHPLLAAEPAEREQLLRSAEPAALSAALQALGHRRDVAAAEVLAQVDTVVDDRALRKTARRELHRLRSIGIEPPAVQSSVAPARRPSSSPADRWRSPRRGARISIRAAAARCGWSAERPLGGIWFAALLLNDTRGLQDLSLVETTRKRFQREFEASRSGAGTWVSLPGEYACGWCARPST